MNLLADKFVLAVTKDVEAKLIESLNELKYEIESNFAIHFHLRLLNKDHQGEYQLKIAVNVINTFFKNSTGTIFLCKDKDIIVIYKGEDRSLINKIIYQIRYLFIDDQIAFSKEGIENPNFSSVYILNYQWQDFFNICNNKIIQSSENIVKQPTIKNSKVSVNKIADDIDKGLENIDLAHLTRSQSICALPPGAKQIKIIFYELYISISHLREFTKYETDYFSNKKLFGYFTERLDNFMLQMLEEKLKNQQQPCTISINLNITTLLSINFNIFDNYLKNNSHIKIVVEINVADIFTDMAAFISAREHIQNLGYRVCLDGLNILDFIQIDRANLGFDLIKLQWNADSIAALSPNETKLLIESIQNCGSNRMILCRCDDQLAIDYGHHLGISLFQGWHLDKLTKNQLKNFII